MIRRLYVDNFRSLVDFTWEPGAEALVLGYNGSGKTSALDALEIVRNWNWGWEHVLDTVGRRDQTRFDDREAMRFHLDLDASGELFQYTLELRYSKNSGDLYHVEETLASGIGGRFDRRGQEITLDRGQGLESFKTSIPLRQSSSSLLSAAPDASFVHRFRKELGIIVNVRPIPMLAKPTTSKPEERPSRSFGNFVSWYWDKTSNGAYQRAFLELLADPWEDFSHLDLEIVGRETRVLKAVFGKASVPDQEVSYDLDDLSDGERMLIVLYSLLAYQKSQPPTTIIIDEPDNFVSILEIQPWLLKMLDTCPDEGQIILVSHNEELIRTMGREQVAYFSRKDHLSPTTVRSIRQEETEVAPLRDLLRRGWLDE